MKIILLRALLSGMLTRPTWHEAKAEAEAEARESEAEAEAKMHRYSRNINHYIGTNCHK